GVFASGLAYDSSKGEIFAANGYNGVSVISDSTNTVVANVTGPSGIQGIAYDSGNGEIFVGNSVISDSNNAVVAQVPTALGLIVYDSSKGEIIGGTNTEIAIFSNSSYTIKVPEFSSAALFSLAAVMVVVSLGAATFNRKKSRKIDHKPT
ncbi:MAG: hypothetical protein ABSF65_11900, partial [Candidatus Bathyarchaeia archaeon]